MGIRAFRFHYIGSEVAETFPFYRKYIRGFLRWHRGDAVWVKGGTGKRDAHIIVKEWLVPNLFRMMKDVNLKHGGKFSVREVNPYYIIYEAKELDRQTVGYLRDGNVELGDRDAINCPKDDYRELSVQGWCWGRERGARCDAWDGRHCIYPRMTEEAMKRREARLKGTPDEAQVKCPDQNGLVLASECDRCRLNDPVKWRACQEFKLEVKA